MENHKVISEALVPEDRCPSLVELEEHLRAGVEAIDRHLAECRRCQARLAVVQRTASDLVPTESRAMPAGSLQIRPEVSRSLEFGAVCAIASDSRPGERLVAVVVSADPDAAALSVAPINTSVELASSWDLIVPATATPLSYQHLVEVWNHGRIARVQVEEVIGQLSTYVAEGVGKLFKAELDDRYRVEGLAVGSEILTAEDPRLNFQRDEAARASRFFTPDVRVIEDIRFRFAERVERHLQAADASLSHQLELVGVGHDVIEDIINPIHASLPDAEDLGRLCRVLAIDINAGTREADDLEDDLYRRRVSDRVLLKAARRPARAGSFVRRAVMRVRGVDRAQAVADYMATARAAAAGSDSKT